MVRRMTENSNAEEAKKAPPLDPIAELILEMAAGSERSVHPRDVAIRFHEARKRQSDSPTAWRKYLVGVRQQAIFLARQGRIDILRKGKTVDPSDFKGLYRLGLPQARD